MKLLYFKLTLNAFIIGGSGWNTIEEEVYDAVEFIKTNFYTLLNVSNDANCSTIKRSFRSLSLTVHPDKNNASDAEQQFTKLSLAHDILKHPEKRKYYDDVLKNGLPTWRSTAYYYSKARKLSLVELACVLCIAITIAHLLLLWTAYIERYIKENQAYEKKKKSIMRKSKKISKEMDSEIKVVVEKPKITDLLPFLLLKCVISILVKMVNSLKNPIWYRYKECYSNEGGNSNSNKQNVMNSKRSENKTIKKKPRTTFAHAKNVDPVIIDDSRIETEAAKVDFKDVGKDDEIRKDKKWTKEDLYYLIELNTKYPPGHADRWGKISALMKRSTGDVIEMTKSMKRKEFLQMRHGEEITEHLDLTPISNNDKNVWSQEQQEAFENALKQFGKGCEERWDKIADSVNGKTKADCILRYKEIASNVLKKKKH